MVTGAGSGIGLATAELLLASGASVVLCGRDIEKIKSALAGSPHVESAEPYQVDVGRHGQVEGLIRHIVNKYGRLDGAFNNAGVFGHFGLLEHDSESNFDAVVDTNLRGIWSCMKFQIPEVLKTGGAIVNCSSVAGHQGHAMSPIYSATKHAVIGLTKSAALQYAAAGIRINVISPGSTDTPILRMIYKDKDTFDQRAARAPMGRVGDPAEVAKAVVWLLSSESSYVNGHTLIVDGGVLAGSASAKSVLIKETCK